MAATGTLTRGGPPLTPWACAVPRCDPRPYNLPSNQLNYVENFLYMLDRLGESEYRPDPRLCRILEMMFIIYAEHELNCSTAAMRQWGSTGMDPYTAVAGAAAALYGPAHGGANEAALRMLQAIGTVDNVPKFIADVKAKKTRLMGFGHRVYKSYDPRARILKSITSKVAGGSGQLEQQRPG